MLKLSLHRETLRRLNGVELLAVAGGIGGAVGVSDSDSGQPAPSSGCSDTTSVTVSITRYSQANNPHTCHIGVGA